MTSGDLVGLVAILGMLALMVVRVPIGITMLMAGGLGYAWLGGWAPLLNYVKSAAYYQMASESFSVIPLFLLMGFLASRAGISRTLFDCANAFLGHVRGGLAIAAIGGCGMFGAICGSSLATAATMGQVTLPEMRRYGYSGSLATGALAAGGSLGILIPPSIVLVVYAILTEQNIAKLFLAAFLPGLLAVLGYMAAIAVYVRLRPEAGPAGRRASWAERGRMLVAMIPVVILFLLVLGGIYSGVFTPTEAASFGVAGTLVMAITMGGAGLADILDCLVDMAISSGMIFVILIGADLFNAFLALSGLPQDLAQAITASGLPPMAVIVLILLVYLVLGCLMDSLSMILLTLPIFFPAVMSLKLGLSPEHTAIWFGIIALIVVEVGLITPPVGLNVFVINKLAGDVPMAETFRGVVPFLISDFIRVAILLTFPFLTYAMLIWTGS